MFICLLTVLLLMTSENAEDLDITWSELYRRVSVLEAEVTQQTIKSRDTKTRLERDLSQATRRETELTKRLQTAELKLRRTERLLIKPGYECSSSSVPLSRCYQR